jgi:hypothetical protein
MVVGDDDGNGGGQNLGQKVEFFAAALPDVQDDEIEPVLTEVMRQPFRSEDVTHML